MPGLSRELDVRIFGIGSWSLNNLKKLFSSLANIFQLIRWHDVEVYGGKKNCSPSQFKTGKSPPSYIACNPPYFLVLKNFSRSLFLHHVERETREGR